MPACTYTSHALCPNPMFPQLAPVASGLEGSAFCPAACTCVMMRCRQDVCYTMYAYEETNPACRRWHRRVQGELQLARLLPLCAFVFLGILYREILSERPSPLLPI